MAKKQGKQNTGQLNTNTFFKGLNKDADPSFVSEGEWTHARNAVNNTAEGNLGTLSNESSNYLCIAAGETLVGSEKKIIGAIHLFSDKWVIFTTSILGPGQTGKKDEIGLFQEDLCSYKIIVQDNCLNFDRYNLITGASREKEDCSWAVYFADSNNPDRYLNIGDPQIWPSNDFVWASDNEYTNGSDTIQWPGVQWIEDCPIVNGCKICVDTQELDCNAIRLARLVDTPCLTIESGTQGGTLFNGSYFVVLAYTIKNQKVTDYYSPSNVQPIWHKDNARGGLKINVEADSEHFDEFELVIIQNINQGAVAKKIGYYSTRTTTIYIDQIKEDLIPVQLSLIPLQNPIFERSDEIVEIDNYLLRIGPTSKFDFNYQPLANLIKAKWASVEYPARYYSKGGHKPSYLRDENYPFFIRWVYNTGDKTSSYHIPGRGPRLFQNTGLFENSVYSDDDSLPDDTLLFETINTATSGTPNGTVLPDGGVVLRTGDMGYWQSTEFYPDNKPEIWNSSAQCWTGVYGQASEQWDLCGLQIRHHKFPEQSVNDDVNHFIDNGTDGSKIRILGVLFENIIYPKDNDGNDIPNLVGYEILRGARDGNKTIIAKGMLNNMRPYRVTGGGTAGLYPNHPFNTINPTGKGIIGATDPYIRAVDNDDNTINVTEVNIPEDIITFHSPDTEFKEPFLGTTELKLYGNISGESDQQFIEPSKHTKDKLLKDVAMWAAIMGGIIEAIIAQLGKRTINAPGASFTRIYESDYTQESIGGGASGNEGLTGLWSVTGLGPLTFSATNVTATTNVTHSNLNGNDGSTEIVDIPDDTGGDVVFTDAETVYTNEYDEYFNNGQAVNEGLSDIPFIGSLITPPADGSLQDRYDRFNLDGGLDAGGTYTAPSYNTELSKHQYIKNSGLATVFPPAIGQMLYYFSEGADLVIRLIYSLVPYRQRALQLIAHGYYDTFNKVDLTKIRRFNIEDEFYLGQDLQEMSSYTPATFGFPVTYRINNLRRSETVVIRTSEGVSRVTGGPNFLTGPGADDSLVTIGTSDVSHVDFKKGKTKTFNKNIKSHYGGIKVRIGNQYGQLQAIKQIPITPCEQKFEYDDIPITTLAPACSLPQFEQKIIQTTPILFEGDTYINRYTEKNSMFMFHDWLYDQPDGTEYNYLNRKMIPNPRFWMNSIRYEANAMWSNLLDFLSFVPPPEGEGLFPHNYYNLDWRNYNYTNDNSILGTVANLNNGIFGIKNAYFYLSTSAVKDFYVESDVIVDFREQGDEIFEKHYDPYGYTDLYRLFDMNPDVITRGNYNEYDYSLSISKLFTQYFSQGNLQARFYDPQVAELCYTYYPDRILYSLPQELESVKDSWFMYLPNNYKEFKNQISSVKNFAKTGIFITFKNASPMVYQGVDTLQTDLGTKVTLGDGGLFNQAAQNVVAADEEYEYGSSQNGRSVISTPAGMFYISQNQGKIFSYASGLQEISSSGLKWWFNKFLPFQLLEDFPNYPHTDNPVAGIGCHSIYDNENSVLYFAKKDYKLKDPFKGRVVWDEELKQFIVDDVIRTNLKDTNIFEDASWTMSYDPKSKFWVSHHDWHPNIMLASKGNFLTAKDNGIWKHNNLCNEYCNFYGTNYPFEVEIPIVTGQTITTMKSVEYLLECYRRNEYNCVDQFHVLDYNFDTAVIHNTEQVSGYLDLFIYPKNNVPLNLTYPIINGSSIDILFSKEEHKYRFNQFWDITRDRGEFPIGSSSPTTNPVIPGTTTQLGGKQQRHIWITESNGYIKALNEFNLNYTKEPLQRKKFRHYNNMLYLRKDISNGVNMVVKIVNTKNQISPR